MDPWPWGFREFFTVAQMGPVVLFMPAGLCLQIDWFLLLGCSNIDPWRIQQVDPPILDSNTLVYSVDYRTLRWIYFLDPPNILGIWFLCRGSCHPLGLLEPQVFKTTVSGPSGSQQVLSLIFWPLDSRACFALLIAGPEPPQVLDEGAFLTKYGQCIYIVP